MVNVTVDAGPSSIATTVYSPENFLYVTVTVCQPGTSTCATIDHVQVSTATVGLRVLQSAVTGVTLPNVKDPNAAGNTLAECYQLPQGTAWGGLVTADVQIAGETASNVPIQLLSTPTVTPDNSKGACTDNGWLATVQTLGANGVLGIGPLAQDCAAAGCVNQYYTCKVNPSDNTVSCQTNVTAAAPKTAQVANPVTMFARDNNGVIITLPKVDPVTGAPSGLTGQMAFGIGTQSDNAYNGTATALAADASTAEVATSYTSQAPGSSPVQYRSWFDTGSVPYQFTDAGIQLCTKNGLTTFYCPAAPLNLQATVKGAGGVGSATVNFTVANAETLNSANPNSIVFSTLGARPADGFGGAGSIIWGLPFFFGRSVYIAYPGANITGSGGAVLKGPFYAF